MLFLNLILYFSFSRPERRFTKTEIERPRKPPRRSGLLPGDAAVQFA
jgi:hypothetical protein